MVVNEKYSHHWDHHGRRPHFATENGDTHSPPATHQLISKAGVAKAILPWADLIVKSFLGGVFIAIRGCFDLVVARGAAAGLRASNPSLVTLIAGFTFLIRFLLVLLTNVKLATGKMFVVVFTTLLRKMTVYDLVRN